MAPPSVIIGRYIITSLNHFPGKHAFCAEHTGRRHGLHLFIKSLTFVYRAFHCIVGWHIWNWKHIKMLVNTVPVWKQQHFNYSRQHIIFHYFGPLKLYHFFIDTKIIIWCNINISQNICAARVTIVQLYLLLRYIFWIKNSNLKHMHINMAIGLDIIMPFVSGSYMPVYLNLCWLCLNYR